MKPAAIACALTLGTLTLGALVFVVALATAMHGAVSVGKGQGR